MGRVPASVKSENGEPRDGGFEAGAPADERAGAGGGAG